MKLSIIWIIYLIVFGVCWFALGYLSRPVIDARAFGQMNIKEIDQCSNLSLDDAAYCMANFQKKFYNYTPRNDIPKSLEDIKENGGDCYDYNSLHEKTGDILGFNSYSFDIKISDNSYHRFAVISNKEGYCVVDQTEVVGCEMLKK